MKKHNEGHQHPAGRTPTILCIDDDPEVSRLMGLHLDRFDVKFVRAFHGMHGIYETLKCMPDLIVLDLSMPNGDGASVLECLRRNKATGAIPVIILTGRRNPILRHRLLSQGADQFLEKPVPPFKLLQEIRRFVHLRERPHTGELAQPATRGVTHATPENLASR
jgi:two-component system, OmpR family, response regulator RpaA